MLDFDIKLDGKNIGASGNGFEYIAFTTPKGGREIQLGGVEHESLGLQWVKSLGTFVQSTNDSGAPTWRNVDGCAAIIGRIINSGNQEYKLYPVYFNDPSIIRDEVWATCSYPGLRILDGSGQDTGLTCHSDSESHAIGLLAAYALIEGDLSSFRSAQKATSPASTGKSIWRRLFG